MDSWTSNFQSLDSWTYTVNHWRAGHTYTVQLSDRWICSFQPSNSGICTVQLSDNRTSTVQPLDSWTHTVQPSDNLICTVQSFDNYTCTVQPLDNFMYPVQLLESWFFFNSLIVRQEQNIAWHYLNCGYLQDFAVLSKSDLSNGSYFVQ